VKMLLGDVYKIPIGLSLAVVASILAVSIVASLFRPKKAPPLPKTSIPESPLVTSRREDA